MKSKRTFEELAGLLGIFALAIGCLYILWPFLTSILWAAVLVFSTWPVFRYLKTWLGNRPTLAAGLMTILIATLLVAPFAIVILTLADNTAQLIHTSANAFEQGLPPPPAFLSSLPVIGESLAGYWQSLTSDSARMTSELKRLIQPGTQLALAVGGTLGKGITQLSISVFIAFFMYQSGTTVAAHLHTAMERITQRSEHLLAIAGSTVQGVVYGVIGTALVQGILAGIGFWVAGVPGSLFLGFLTFVLSIIPMGPPLVWIPAVAWVISQGNLYWGLGLLAWSLCVVSSVDNVLKPVLISRGSNLPFILVFLGALGGILGFGFIGLFLGPTLLAVGFTVLNDWIAEKRLATGPYPAEAAAAE